MEEVTGSNPVSPTVNSPNSSFAQDVYREMLVGALIYSVVFGFFNDYTDILYTSSYSTTFLAAVVMQALVYPTFKFKGWIARYFTRDDGTKNTIALVGCVWAVMFVSKFIFLGILNFVFGDNIEIRGFVGLVVIIICATVLTKLAEAVYEKL